LKIGRFKKDNEVFFGMVRGREVVPLKQKRVTELMDSIEPEDTSYDISSVKFLPPTRVTKIVAVGLNYRAHAEEMGKPIPSEPLIFLKPSTAVISNKMKIMLPKVSDRVDYEGELAVVIGRRCRKVSPEEAKDFILGYSCLNDVTARDIQKDWEALMQLIRKAQVETGIQDLAHEHDHYLYGKPKKSQQET